MKKLHTRILSALLAIMLIVSILPLSVSASTTGTVTKSISLNSNMYFWGSETISKTFTYADGTSATFAIGGMSIHYVDGKTAYCIEPQTSSTNNTTYSGTTLDSSVFWKNKLTENQRRAIGLILLYGAPNYLHSTDAYTEFGYEGATQLLIWEIVTGMRDAVKPYTRNDARLYNNFRNDKTFPSLDTGYAQIVNSIQNHLTIPSFSSRYSRSAPAITLDYNSSTGICSGKVTDTNGVLASDYNFSAPGVTFSRSSNTLSISAPLSVLESGTVMASATGRSLNEDNLAAMIWTCPGKQTLITTVDSSADPVPAYFTLKAGIIPGTTNITKTADNGDVEGYCFKIYKWTDNLSWFGKSGSDGRVYITDRNFNQSDSTRTYSFSGMTDGTYSFLEVLSQKGAGTVFPDSWKIRVIYEGIVVYSHTFTADELTQDANGDCRLDRVYLSGLTDGGGMELTIHNAPLTGDLEIVKQSDDGKVSGISFSVLDENNTLVSTNETDTSGHLTVESLEIGKTYTVRETVPPGYISEDDEQTITIQTGSNTLTFVNHTIPTLKIIKTSETDMVQGFSFTVYDRNGVGVASGETNAQGIITLQDQNLREGKIYTVTEDKQPGYVCTENAQTIMLHSGVNDVSFYNRLVRGSLKIKKVEEGTEMYLSGAGFRVFDSNHTKIAESYTDKNGEVEFNDLPFGDYTYQEFEAPRGYVLDNTPHSFSITEDDKVISVTASNAVKVGSIKIQKVDPDGHPLAGVYFKLEYSLDGSTWVPIRSRQDGSAVQTGYCTASGLSNGVLVTDEDGIAEFKGLCISTDTAKIYYRLTETATLDGYSLLTERAFSGELTEDEETDITLTVVNTPFFSMPSSGGKGFWSSMISLCILFAALASIVLLLRKKEY